MRVYNRAMGSGSWASVEDYLPAGHALGYNWNWQYRHTGGELLMMGATGEPSGYYPTDTNGLSISTTPPVACVCYIFLQSLCAPILDGGCGGRCEEMPPILPPLPPGLPQPGFPSPGYYMPLWVRIPIWGNYCGPGHGHRGPGGPPPFDELDACCQIHDNCYGAHNCDNPCWWRLKCACLNCDIDLLMCAKKADCSRSPDPKGCEKARKLIIAAMALVSTRGCLF